MQGDSQTFQVKLWALAGLWMCLLNLFVISLTRVEVPFFLPLSVVIGALVCWAWKLPGFMASALILVVLMAFNYSTIPLLERFWFIGIGISVALSLLITALSFEEVEAMIEGMAIESRSRLENLWKVDEKKKIIEEELAKKKEEVREIQIKVRSYQKVVDMSVEEMLGVRNDYQELSTEFQKLKEEQVRLEEELKKGDETPQSEARYRQLKEQFEEKSKTLDQTRRDLFIANEKLFSLQRDHEEMKLYSLGEVEQVLERHIILLEKEREETEESHRKEVEALQAMVSSILEERGVKE